MVSITFPPAFVSLLLLAGSCGAENSTDSNVDIFGEELPDDMNVFDVVQNLVTQLTDRLKCVHYGLKQSECVSCLRTDKILELLQIESNQRFLTKREVIGLSTLLLHHTVHFAKLCRVEPQGCTDYSSCRDEIVYQMRVDGPLESLEAILREVKEVLEPGPIDECFSAETVLAEVSKFQFIDDDEKVGQTIAILMKHIFRGQCIDVGESLTDFLDDIFYLYGERCASVIEIDGLKRIMHDLQNNGIHSHDHADHDHNDHEEEENSHHRHKDHDHKHQHYASDCKHFTNNLDHFHPHDHEEHIHEHDDDHDHNHDHEMHSHEHQEKPHQQDQLPYSHTNHKRVAFPYSDVETFEKILDQKNDVTNNTSKILGTESERQQPVKDIMYDEIATGSDNVTLANEPEETARTYPVHSKTNQSSSLTETSSFTTIDADNDESYSITVDNSSSSHDKQVTDVALHDMSSNASEVGERSEILSSGVSGADGVVTNDTSPTLSGLVSDNSASPHDGDFPPENDLVGAASMRSEFYHQAETTGRSNDIPLNTENVHRMHLLEREEMSTPVESLLEREGELHHHTSLASKCLSVEELVARFGHASNSSLTKLEFLQLCPALVQQIVSGVCQTRVVANQNQPTNWELYGYSTLAVFVISLTSLAGVVFLPILAKQAYYYVMAGCIGLAFSTLAGDAFLHLIPQALGLHNHNEDDHSHGHEGDSMDPSMWKQLGVFFAVYLLYLFEATVCVFSKKNQHSHNRNAHGHSHIPDALPKELTLVSIKVKSDSNAQLAMSPERSTSLDTEIAEIEVIKKPNHVVLSTPSICGLSTVALLITLGDSIHNFGDGLAIGAAFSSGIRSGLSTSIAVFCHELPHEFGDFVILLSSGLSFGKALWINFLSGLTCLIGLYIGIQLGVNETARAYILAVTAGIFLYVALTEMLPQLKENKKGHPVKMLLVKNVGILLGITIMVLMSVYEHYFYL